VQAYRRLLQHLDNYRRTPVLACDEAMAVAFQKFGLVRLRIGTMDLSCRGCHVPPCDSARTQSRRRSSGSRLASRGLHGMMVGGWTVSVIWKR